MRSAQTFGALTTLLLYNQNLLLPPFQRSIWKTRNACTLTCHFPNISNSWMAKNLVFGKKHETTTFCTTFQTSKRVTGSMLHLKAVCWKGKAKTMAEESGGNSSTEDVTQPFPVNFRRSEMVLNCWDGLWISFASSRGQLTGSLGSWPFHDQWLPIFLRILAIVWLHVFYKNDLANKQLIRTWPQQRLPIATITSNPICLDLGCTHFNKTPQRDRIHLPNMSHSLLHAPGGSCFFSNLFNSRSCGVGRYGHWKIQAGITWSKGSWLHLISRITIWWSQFGMWKQKPTFARLRCWKTHT